MQKPFDGRWFPTARNIFEDVLVGLARRQSAVNKKAFDRQLVSPVNKDRLNEHFLVSDCPLK